MPQFHANENPNDFGLVYEVIKMLVSSRNTEQTLDRSLRHLSYTLGWRSAFIAVAEPDGHLASLCYTGLPEGWGERVRFLSGEGIVGRIHTSDSPMLVSEVHDEPVFKDIVRRAGGFDGKHVALLGTPIRHEGRPLGVLIAFCERPDEKHGFASELQLMEVVAAPMAQALLLDRDAKRTREVSQQELSRPQIATLPLYQIDNVVGGSASMQRIFAQVHKVASAKTTVLLRGESGTGKELIARAIYRLSPRKEQPFISVNCAALTETLLESELFGHEKGAFTGAQSQRKGRFELAHGGTLFLDEIGDISPSFQAKLLRVLQEREFERVGGTTPVRTDVRLIVATNRNLESMVKGGEFRSDLYYRINVVNIVLPPLRERREDIPAMAQYFLDHFNRENGRSLHFSDEAMQVLSSCYWPGNVRELENCVERTATMSCDNTIDRFSFLCEMDQCLTQELHHIEREDAVRPARTSDCTASEVPNFPTRVAAGGLNGGVSEVSSVGDRPEGKRERLVWAMERSGWVQAKAARLLGITPRQIGYALRKHGITIRRF
ncbi:nif-specific transcriptional activator NifA [Cupriavidus consociatus]|uniref:nif-specific transcriptional activator NifA n=1 Tax=Cupriavidus consociatus TaxID=2821357 RepID=UPI001AE2FD18|nr:MULTISPECIES: nif-specific transcriptional activator NifA [unclassified Cupriavidus]MBP0625145.1 nif-specific transcriptional activator NifA [Cupriavidus sp. LEh25]MDK2661884.1 nif-specific transcriptional activator NifA [Cupriavidus sp. LEh21]